MIFSIGMLSGDVLEQVLGFVVMLGIKVSREEIIGLICTTIILTLKTYS